jgi:maleate cis-trans isomerase
MTLLEATTEARARKDAGFFDRAVITRQVKTISTDGVTLSCGHSAVVLPLYRAEAEIDDRVCCSTCAAAWIHDAMATPLVDVVEALS